MKAYFFNNERVPRPDMVQYEGTYVISPSDSLIVAAGYEIRDIEPEPPSYEQRVVARIRERYSINDELALLRQRESKADEFAAYNTYCEQVKAEEKESIK